MENHALRSFLPKTPQRSLVVPKTILAGILVAAFSGCQTRQLIRTPNLYVNASEDPFSDVPEVHRTSEVDLLFFTDRVPDGEKERYVEYGVGRSLSVGWGSAIVSIGNDIDWPTLAEASLEKKRSIALPVKVVAIRELGRFPQTPALLERVDGQWQAVESYSAELVSEQEVFLEEFRRRLAMSDVKEAYIMVHGYHNSLEDGALVIAEMWHFMGRKGVPIVYSWPAGKSGALRGYTYDSESSEFTVHHLKEVIRLLSSCDELEALHIIGHSRGTDVVSSAVRELDIETRAAAQDTAAKFKIRNVILAAPDLDMDVISQRLMAERILDCADRITIYVSDSDKALFAASTLFGSTRRMGQVRVDDFSEEEKEMLSNADAFHFVDAEVSTDFLSHGYFHNDPAVCSDVILVLTTGAPPGRENGRPLEPLGANFWRITDEYPRFDGEPPR